MKYSNIIKLSYNKSDAYYSRAGHCHCLAKPTFGNNLNNPGRSVGLRDQDPGWDPSPLTSVEHQSL